MAGTGLFQLLNPLMLAVFAAGFGIVYAYDRQRNRSALFFASSYAIIASALTLDFFRPALPPVVSSYATNGLYLLGVSLFTVALSIRYRRPVPLRWLALICAAAICGITWYFFFDPSLVNRSFIMSYAGAALFAAGLPAAATGERLIDRFLFWETAINAVQMVLRSTVILSLTGDGITMENYMSSIYGITFHFSVAIIGLSIAATLFVAFGMDIVQALADRTQIDHLSGLLNRRGFEERAAALLEGGHGPYAMIVCDIDHFKQINDNFGHATGDDVIREMASVISGATPDNAVVGRIGGEEFAVLAPRMNLQLARIMCESMRAALALATRGDVKLPAYTASFGATEMGGAEPLASAMERADEALYRAKRSGRDRVCISESPASPRLAGDRYSVQSLSEYRVPAIETVS